MLSALSAPSESRVLHTLGSSHYCERARWALDGSGLAYREVRHALGPHVAHLRNMGLSDTAMPVLYFEGKYVQGSGCILDICGFASQDVAIEDRFATRIGGLTRRFVYAAAFSSPNDGGMLDVMLGGVAFDERAAGRAAWPLLRGRLAKALGASTGDLPAIIDALDEELVWVDHQIKAGDMPLAGAFGRMHITAASMLAPLVRPPESAVRKPLVLTGLAAQALHAWSKRPFWHWTQATYSRCRHTHAKRPM